MDLICYDNKNNLFADIKTLIEQSKQQIAVAINSAMTMLYWQIGGRIKTDILQNKRAEYGQEIIKQLSANLTEQYGKGWSEKHLRHCLRVVETFPDIEIISTLWRQLSWSHIKTMMYIEVADYLTQLPDKQFLEQKLRIAIETAKQRLDANNNK